MKIRQIITDYIRRSLLTTQGDMIVRGAALPARLVAVAAGQVLKSAGVGALPAWGLPTIGDGNIAEGSYIHAAGSDKVISGLGFTLKLILFFAIDTTIANLNWSVTISGSTTVHTGIAIQNNHTDMVITTTSYTIRRDVNNRIFGELSVIGNDGFTVAHTLVGACSATVGWFAIG